MSGHPAQRTWREIYRTTPKELWLATRTPTCMPYPCRCRPGCKPEYCPCWGRDDLVPTAGSCCAPRHPKHATEETETA
jgi:hypothetical protein